MSEQIRILCVDDEKNVLSAVERVFFDTEYTVHTAASAAEGLDILKSVSPVQVVFSDYRMPEMNGVEFLKQVRAAWPETVRIVLSGYSDMGAVIAAINEGRIYKFIPKPWNDDDLRITAANAVERYHLQMANQELTERLGRKTEEYRKMNTMLQLLVTEKTSEMTFQNKVFAFFKNVFEALPAAAVCINAAGYIIQTNNQAKTLFHGLGISPSGKHRAEALPADWNDFIDGVFRNRTGAATISGAGSPVRVTGRAAAFSDEESGVVLLMDGVRTDDRGNDLTL